MVHSTLQKNGHGNALNDSFNIVWWCWLKIPSCDKRGGENEKPQHEQSIGKQIFYSVPPDEFGQDDDYDNDEYFEKNMFISSQ